MLDGRAPQGARGLKLLWIGSEIRFSSSRPARGAWVEIKALTCLTDLGMVAPRKGRVG